MLKNIGTDDDIDEMWLKYVVFFCPSNYLLYLSGVPENLQELDG